MSRSTVSVVGLAFAIVAGLYLSLQIIANDYLVRIEEYSQFDDHPISDDQCQAVRLMNFFTGRHVTCFPEMEDDIGDGKHHE